MTVSLAWHKLRREAFWRFPSCTYKYAMAFDITYLDWVDYAQKGWGLFY